MKLIDRKEILETIIGDKNNCLNIIDLQADMICGWMEDAGFFEETITHYLTANGLK